MKPKVFIFGAGESGKSASLHVYSNCEILGFIDNNSSKWNENFQGKKVYDPSILTSYNYDYVIIASMYEHEILHQLTEQGINSDKIILPGNYTNSKYFPWESVILLLTLSCISFTVLLMAILVFFL